MTPVDASPQSLKRELGPLGATMLGLGSIIGTGIFVSIGLAAAAAGSWLLASIVIAGLLATCNALSSAQLAARFPVSGGAYEYGYRLLSPTWGFVAGWMFLCAKTASAATAALGLAGYMRTIAPDVLGPSWMPILAVAAVAMITVVVLAGMRRSSTLNMFVVAIAMASLLALVIAGLVKIPNVQRPPTTHADEAGAALAGMLEGAALMFVAYTGYGRLATLGEEVREPARTIPRAITITLSIAMLTFLAVAYVSVRIMSPDELGFAARTSAAPLEEVARRLELPWLRTVLRIGAMAAMLAVILNLVLGLSRVLLAMARRGDMPRPIGRLNQSRATPVVAVLIVGSCIATLAAVGSVRLAWSFSAVTVLIYYTVMNFAALRLGREHRLYHPIVPVLGMFGCLGLVFWVKGIVWVWVAGVLACGFIIRFATRRMGSSQDTQANPADSM